MLKMLIFTIKKSITQNLRLKAEGKKLPSVMINVQQSGKFFFHPLGQH